MTTRENKKWENGEIENVLNLISLGETYENISQKFQRESHTIKMKVLETLVNKIDEGKALEAYYCNEYNIEKNDIDDFRRYKS